MIVYGAILLPIVLTIAAVTLFPKRFVWWEPIIPIVVGLILVVTCKGCTELVACTDTEYWGGYVITASYFESWDEEVPCRHPIYKTETTTNSDGTTSSRQVYVGDEHSYDVDDHPPYWEMYDSNGERTSINQNEYSTIKSKGSEKFIDLHRNYHSKDGDQYKVDISTTIIPVVKEHTYENRVQASSSVYKPKKLAVEEKKRVYDYPLATSSFFFSSNGWMDRRFSKIGRIKRPVWSLQADKNDDTCV